MSELAVLVVDELLEERPADALRRAAAHLSLDERGVERAADVLRDHVAEQLDLAGLAVDADVREVRRDRRRAARLRRAAVPLDRLVAPAEAERLLRDLLDGDRAVGRADRADDAVDDLEVVGRDLELLRGGREQLLARRLGRAQHRRADRVRDLRAAARARRTGRTPCRR